MFGFADTEKVSPMKEPAEKKQAPVNYEKESSPVRTSGPPRTQTPLSMMTLINTLLKSLSNKPKGGDAINQESTFGINGANASDKQFVSKACKLKFPTFKQLVLGYLDKYETKDEIGK